MLIGEILIEQGVLKPAQLEEGLEAQVVHGGRLGTNLVELGHVTEEQLARALGRQHGINFSFGDIVPAKDALTPFDLNYLDDRDVLPVRIDGGKLYLLVVNPGDIEARDHVQRVAGKRAVPVVVCEFRMAQLQRRYCKAFRPVRAVDVSDVKRRKQDTKKEELAKPPETGDLMGEEEFANLYAEAMSGGSSSAAAEEELLEEAPIVGEALPELDVADIEVVEEQPPAPVVSVAPAPPIVTARPAPFAVPPRVPTLTPAAQPPKVLPSEPRPDAPPPPVFFEEPGPSVPVAVALPPKAPAAPIGVAAPLQRKPAPEPVEEPITPLTFAEAQKALQTPKNRDEIARTVLRFAVGKNARALLLSVQGDLAVGWDAAGQGLTHRGAKRIGFSLKSASAFRLARDSRSHYVGPLRKEPGNLAFIKALGVKGVPKSVVIMPILASGKVVNMLFCDNGPGQLASPDIGELLILAQSVGRSYDEMIAARKRAASTRAG